MSASSSEPAFSGQSPGFDSRDCVNLVLEAVGDRTVRPLRPQLLRLALAERERLAKWQEQSSKQPSEDKPTDASDPHNGTS